MIQTAPFYILETDYRNRIEARILVSQIGKQENFFCLGKKILYKFFMIICETT